MEVEFKFQIPADRYDTVDTDLRLGSVRRTRLRACYFDMENGALADRKIVLRMRLEGRRWVWTVKIAGRGPLDRLVHNAYVEGDGSPAVALPDARRHGGTPVGKLLAKALAQSDQPLIEVYSTDIWRIVRCERETDAYVEFAREIGRFLGPAHGSTPPRATRICELEHELLEGPVPGLVTMAQRWSQNHGLWSSTVSKAAHGERPLAGTDVVATTKATPPVFHGKAATRPTGADHQQAVIMACLSQVLPNASEIAAGSEDSEQIHQLRVGLRRLRTALRELAPLAAGFDPAWQTPLAQTFRALGACRNRETVLHAISPRLAAKGAPAVVLPADISSVPSPAKAVQAASFQAALAWRVTCKTGRHLTLRPSN